MSSLILRLISDDKDECKMHLLRALMDAVSKNLKVRIEVSKQLGTEHIPIHIVCKSHTCEKLDEACINVLYK